jgi:hypothetical protein
MTKAKSQTAIESGQRRWYQRRLRILLFIVAMAAVFLGLVKWYPPRPSHTYRTLSEILEYYNGSELVQEPDRPGPYEIIAAPNSWVSGPVVGSFRANGETRRFSVSAIPGNELCVVGLVPQEGGGPTYIVLKRKAEPGPLTGRTSK